MFETVTAPLAGPRSTALVETIRLVGFDFRDAAIRLEVRDARNGGMQRAGLDAVASSASEGVTIAYADEDGLPVTTLGIRINETTMEAMPLNPSDPERDHEIVWGMHVTPAGGLKFLAFDGPFTVKASAPE